MNRVCASKNARSRRRNRPPITKKAPGDRPFTDQEIRQTASLIMGKKAEKKVSNLPGSSLKGILALLKKRPVPSILQTVDPAAAEAIENQVARVLRKKEIRVRIVDLGEMTGFPRENARPSCEVMLVEKKGDLLWSGRKNLVPGGGVPTIYITSAFFARAKNSPGLLLQAVLHPVLEWVLDLPHILAVLCESAYNDKEPSPGGDDVSDLNRFIAEEAARDRDFAYFDRILGTEYEPDEFRLEELNARFGDDVEKRNVVVYRARALGINYRKLMETLLGETREVISSEEVDEARKILGEGNPEQALTILRRLKQDPSVKGLSRKEVSGLLEVAIRCFALSADPAYEGLRLEKGNIVSEPWAEKKAREFAELLRESVGMIKSSRGRTKKRGEDSIDPLGVTGKPRIIHVLPELERPSARFIDGHDRAHWVFERSFVEALMAGKASGKAPKGIPAIMACRFVRDGAFPDEKLKLEQQFTLAVKGALEAYRFFSELPGEVHDEIAAFYAARGSVDRLYQLFISLGEESNVARATHLLRDTISKTHSFNYVRYPDTSLAGKVVVITGGGTGMGRSLALEAATHGANVVITGRRPEPLEETRADMEDLIGHLGLTNRTLTVQGDVSDSKYVGEMFDKISREFGRIDILYNNAGVSGPVEFGSVYQEEHFDQYREAVNIHLTGAWLASLEAAKRMEKQKEGGLIVMIGTFYSESIHRHVLHAYPGRLPYTSAQSAKLALGDYLAWLLADKNITVLSLNPSAVHTERIQIGSGVFDKGSLARARIGRHVDAEALRKDTLDRTVTHSFVLPRDFARVALDMHRPEFRRTVGGQRIPMGGVTYEQPPGVVPSPAALRQYPNMIGKVALVSLHRLFGNDRSLFEESVLALARSGADIYLAGSMAEDLESLARKVNSSGFDGTATACPTNIGNLAEVQELFDNLPRIDLLLHFSGSVDWKRSLANIPYGEWTDAVEQFGFVPRLLSWQAEKRMDRDGTDGTIILVGPDLSGVPSIKERDLVQVFQAMLRPAVATESMERALMRKAHAEKTSPVTVSAVNIGLILPGRTDGRNKQADPRKTAASILWLAEEGKRVSGAVILPDEQNSIAGLPGEPDEKVGTMAGRVAVVTGGIRNLGREISLRFAAERASVVAASRHPRTTGLTGEEAASAREALKAGEGVLAAMRSTGGRTAWIDTDISSPDQVRALIDETIRRFTRIDSFVNNAGAGGSFSLITNVMRDHRENWDLVLRSNFLGPWYATSLLCPIMKNQEGGGAIVNVSTHYSDHPYLFRTIYTVSKIAIKALTLALKDSLAGEGIFIADVAPSLIAGPRMDWVMSNYAKTFAAQFEFIPGLKPSDGSKLREQFILSFDRTEKPENREKAAASYLTAVRQSKLPRSTRGEMESWYGRIQEWFRSTVPDHPPTNGQVADAVLFGAKNAKFMEDRFISVSSLPHFLSFPPEQKGAERPIAGRSFLVLAAGSAGVDGSAISPIGEAIAGKGGHVTQIVQSQKSPGQVTILRPKDTAGKAREGQSFDTLTREIDLSDPRVIEPWLDNTLLGGPRIGGFILLTGRSSPEGPILEFPLEDMEKFLGHLSTVLSLFGESLRAVEEEGHLIVVVPPPSSEEGHLVRAAVRQMVRTALAEQHFLYPAKRVNISLLSTPEPGREQEFYGLVTDVLSGRAPAVVEQIPVGPVRP